MRAATPSGLSMALGVKAATRGQPGQALAGSAQALVTVSCAADPAAAMVTGRGERGAGLRLAD